MALNDSKIRQSFHRKWLWRHHKDPKALVVDELVLKHGKGRADIAVINGHIAGYEIKSDIDSLRRLSDQIESYNAVFNRAVVVASEKHIRDALCLVPKWWGIISATEGSRGAIYFKTVKRGKVNPNVDDYSVAQLLWRAEAQAILSKLGVEGRLLRKRRSALYQHIVSLIKGRELRNTVRECLTNRKNWRHR